MKLDQPRRNLKLRLYRSGITQKDASLALGRNQAYIQQYLTRGLPRELAWRDSEILGELLDCDPAELRHRPEPEPGTPPRRRRSRPAAEPDGPLAAVPEIEIEASAGPGTFNDGIEREKMRWSLPEDMLRHEGDANPDAMRILRVRGDSMEPEMREGDRLLVDVSQRTPVTGGLFVLWDGAGLVVKRIEIRPGEPDRLQLISANAAYAPYPCSAEDIRIAGRVLWTLRRA